MAVQRLALCLAKLLYCSDVSDWFIVFEVIRCSFGVLEHFFQPGFRGSITLTSYCCVLQLWPTFFERKLLRDAFKKTLTDLKLEYLDLYLIHFPVGLQVSCFLP